MDTCPHCGATRPPVRDAFCSACFQALDEPPRGQSTADNPAEEQFPLLGLLCGAALGLLSGCGTLTVAPARGSLVFVAGSVIGEILIGATVGFMVHWMIRKTR